ncbi:SWI/SNF-related matrix-associated actin-dependent regulator of chromatin subfamily A-like protein 1 [Glandiceps talaboti]
MSTVGGLSKEQLQRIEENKRKALARRAEKAQQQQQQQQQQQHIHHPQKTAIQQTNQRQQQQQQHQSHHVSRPLSSGQLRSTGSGSPQNKIKVSTVSRQFTTSTTSSSTTTVKHVFQTKQDDPLSKFSSSSQFTKPKEGNGIVSKASNSCKNTSQTVVEKQRTDSSVAKMGIFSGSKSFYSSNKPNGNTSQSKQSHSTSGWQSSKTGSRRKDVNDPPVSPPPTLTSVLGKSLTGDCELISRDRFVVNAGYNSQLIEAFKSMDSRSYDATTKKWNFALKDYSKLMEIVKSTPVQLEALPNAVLRGFHAQLKGKVVPRHIPEHNLNNVDCKLVESLMEFQREGVNFVISRHGRALIADDMGLGKTIQSICIACYYRTEWPVLVVVPSSVKLTWAEAFIRWVPSLDPQRINVIAKSKDSATSGLVNIISYDMMTRKATELKSKRFQVIIMDESHSLKNFKTARTKAAMPLLKAAPRVLLLSGTPALSRPSELYTQIAAIDSKLFPTFHDFGVRYCAGHQNPWGWDYSGSSHMTELQLLLEERIMIRRLKVNVMSQLPSKTRQMIVMDPGVVKTNSQSLKAAAKQMNRAAMNKKEQRGALLQYFSETGAAKIPAVSGYIADLLDSGHKFLVFAHHQIMLDALSEYLNSKGYGYIRIDGSTSSDKRKQYCDKFQADDNCQVAVLSITAASTGLTLHAAALVVFAELFWNPGVLVQAEDRVYRIGQKNCVNIHYLVAKGTADDYIWPLVQEKLNVLSKAGLTKDDFSEAHTKSLKDPKQKDILSYFEESFMEEASEEELQQIAALEAAAPDDIAALKTAGGDGNAVALERTVTHDSSGKDILDIDNTVVTVPQKFDTEDQILDSEKGTFCTTRDYPRVKHKPKRIKQMTLFQTTGTSKYVSGSLLDDDDSDDDEDDDDDETGPVIKRARKK